MTANKADNTVTILYGNGDGTFADAVTLAVGLAPMGVALGDLDGNGVADIVVANSGSNSVSVLLGKVGGGYAGAVNYAVGRLPVAVALGDLDSSGSLDIVVANRVDGTASVLLGAGDGTFGEQVVFGAGDSPVDVGVIDIALDNVPEDGNARRRAGELRDRRGHRALRHRLGRRRSSAAEHDGQRRDGHELGGLRRRPRPRLSTASSSPTTSPTASRSRSRAASARRPIIGRPSRATPTSSAAQGQVIIASNEILDSAEYGINFDAGQRDPWTHPGAAAPLREVNTERLVPCVTIENNLIVGSGTAGILFSGDPNTSGAEAAVPYGRIINNTIYGGLSTAVEPPPVSDFPDGPVTVTSTTTNANALRDFLVGGSVQTVGDATFVGGATSAGYFQSGSWDGVVLTTGDARFAAGPNVADQSSGRVLACRGRGPERGVRDDDGGHHVPRIPGPFPAAAISTSTTFSPPRSTMNSSMREAATCSRSSSTAKTSP